MPSSSRWCRFDPVILASPRDAIQLASSAREVCHESEAQMCGVTNPSRCRGAWREFSFVYFAGPLENLPPPATTFFLRGISSEGCNWRNTNTERVFARALHTCIFERELWLSFILAPYR